MDIFDRVLLLFAANPAASAVAPAPCCTEVPEIAEREVKRGDFLGKGGFGEVYSGTWSRRGQPAALVAIKYVKSSAARNQQRREAAVAESRAEARITRGLRHTNIVQIHGLMPLRKKGLAIIMELVDGGPLSNEETMTGRVWSRAMAEGHNESVRRMTVGLVSGLQYLHDNGIVHRDLKPENILCSKAPVPVLKIADFGLAREIAHSQARMSTFCGTYMYMAPEIYEIYENRNSVFPSQPKYDKNADIYSFALIVFYILSKGVDPDHGWADWTDAKLQGKPPEFPDDFPADIREVVARGCSKSPKERPTLSSFRFALHPLSVRGGSDSAQDMCEKRDVVREMMKHSWKSLNGSVKVKNCPEPLLTAARILSAIGNLYIMDLEQELEQAMHLLRALKREYFDHKATKPSVATKTEKQHKKTTQQATVKEKTPGERRRMLFAIANKVLGGLLSAHALLGREMLLEMAMTIAERYLVNNDDLWTNEDQDGDARQRSVARLSILGSFHLEFAYLSRITGDPKYREKALMMREILKTAPKFRGIYPRKWSVKDGRPRTSRKSPFWDGRVRFYDCLLKAWLMDRTDGEALRMFTEAIEAVTKEVIKKSASGMLYVPSHGFAKEEELVFLQTMESTHCFWGGLYALWSKQQTEQRTADDMLSFGEMLTSTCRTACDRTRTKLAPRCIKFENEDVSQDGEPATAPWNHELERKWSLRHQLEHETVESYFLLWRVTGDQRYRAWGWDVAEAIKKHCYRRGYKGVKNVNQVPAKGYNYDIVALNATLKYLYLMFSDASFFPIDEWVFNSVGHPLPVFGTDTLT